MVILSVITVTASFQAPSYLGGQVGVTKFLVSLVAQMAACLMPHRAPSICDTSSTAWASTMRRLWPLAERIAWVAVTQIALASRGRGPILLQPSQICTSRSCWTKNGASNIHYLHCLSCLCDKLIICGAKTSSSLANFVSLQQSDQLKILTNSISRTKKKWSGPVQYEDPSKELMMLPTGSLFTH